MARPGPRDGELPFSRLQEWIRTPQIPGEGPPRACYLCPGCGTTRLPEEVVCAHCRLDIRTCASDDFDAQLLKALSHPEPETAERAVFLLGVRRIQAAVAALERRYHEITDPFLLRAIVVALDRIGPQTGKRVLGQARLHSSIVVRAEALRRLVQRGGPEAAGAADAARRDPSAHVRLAAFKRLAKWERRDLTG